MKLIHSISHKTHKPYTAIKSTLPNGKIVYDFDNVKVLLALRLALNEGLLYDLLEKYDVTLMTKLLLLPEEWEVDFDKI